MRSIVLLVSGATVVVFAGASAPAAVHSVADTVLVSPRVVVQPAIVTRRQQARIVVSDLRARSVQVRLDGGTYPDGTLLPWRPLRLDGRAWRGSLPAPALRGVYPILLRRGPGASPIKLTSFLRVFAPGTRTRPAFHDPVDVVRWWVHTVPHATLVAVKQWPRPAFDRRDLRLHRLFVVAYSPPGHPRVRDRLGMFITAFRDTYSAPWQFLEATVAP
jgi:hypothetical protein